MSKTIDNIVKEFDKTCVGGGGMTYSKARIFFKQSLLSLLEEVENELPETTYTSNIDDYFEIYDKTGEEYRQEVINLLNNLKV